MPANLTPEYIAAEARYRAAKTDKERLEALREMLSTIPKHKGTEKLQAEIKRKIAQLRTAPKKRGSPRGPSRSTLDSIEREGAGQVALAGLPNSGKSSLLARLTNARPEIADYPFSTLKPLPGMMEFEDVQIQLVDLPPLASGYTEGWVYSHIRNADLVVAVLDLASADPESDLLELLSLLEEERLRLAPEPIEGLDSGMLVKRGLLCGTKLDFPGAREHPAKLIAAGLELPLVAVSASTGEGLEEFKRAVFTALQIIRIYTKEPGKRPDMDKPYILPQGSTVLDLARAIHQDFASRLRFARLWGSGRFEGQQVPRDHALQDRDVVEIHI
ncbi:MAG: TGS domain-containing protein [Candidatus Acetothermia bacterium]|jgi:ribosome-interacting GTPase 1|nr:TGS domain-containing protein [Candidatus Acetothermia bacterium]MDH7505066.1 TGS domain-containing protein [Candidatus Acetothermia bacterium]